MKARARKASPTQIDRWYQQYYAAQNGEPAAAPPFTKVRAAAKREFARLRRSLDRLEWALENPLAPGAAKVMFENDCPWQLCSLNHAVAPIGGMAMAIQVAGDAKKLAKIEQERREQDAREEAVNAAERAKAVRRPQTHAEKVALVRWYAAVCGVTADEVRS